MPMKNDSRIYVAGHRGLVGSALVRILHKSGYENILTSSSSDCDLRSQGAVEDLFDELQPEYVFLAAARVGGIAANKDFPADFIYDNLMIQANVINSAYKAGVQKLLFLGSSCIYPKICDQPIEEDFLLTGPLEPTNEAYAVAKISGVKMCQAFRAQYGFNAISLMPTNLYGPNDNFDLETSHVLPALIRKIEAAKRQHDSSSAEGCSEAVVLWGDGSPRREFLHVDDLASACVVCMKEYNGNEPLNVGTGEDIRISELAEIIADVVGYKGGFIWDVSKPNGTPRKVLNIDRIKSLGWAPSISLIDGIRSTYEWYLANASE